MGLEMFISIQTLLLCVGPQFLSPPANANVQHFNITFVNPPGTVPYLPVMG